MNIITKLAHYSHVKFVELRPMKYYITHAGQPHGRVREWLNRPVSKTGIPHRGIEGSNPSPSAHAHGRAATSGFFISAGPQQSLFNDPTPLSQKRIGNCIVTQSWNKMNDTDVEKWSRGKLVPHLKSVVRMNCATCRYLDITYVF